MGWKAEADESWDGRFTISGIADALGCGSGNNFGLDPLHPHDNTKSLGESANNKYGNRPIDEWGRFLFSS